MGETEVPPIEWRNDFQRYLRDKITVFLISVGVILSFFSFILPTSLDVVGSTAISIVVLLVAILLSYLHALREYTVESLREFGENVSELEGFNAFLDAKYTMPVEVHEKHLHFRVNEEDQDDEITYSYKIKPSEDTYITKFYALIGFDDHSIKWDDIDVSAKDAEIVDHKRRDYGDWVRYIVELRLYEQVRPGNDCYPFSLEQKVNSLSPANDLVNVVVRHETNTASCEIELPEGWKFDGAVAEVEENEDSGLDVTNQEISEPECKERRVEWACGECRLGGSYSIEWFASQVEESNEEIQIEDTQKVPDTASTVN